MVLFVGFYFLMHGVFLSLNSRYFFALVPFILLWFMAGMDSKLKGHSYGLRSLSGLFLVWLSLYANPRLSPADKVFSRDHTYRIPYETFAWLRQSTRPDSFVLAIKASTVHLYTGRYSVSEVPDATMERFRDDLRKYRITHIVVTPTRLMTLGGKNFQSMLGLWSTVDQWTTRWPETFKRIYANDQEGTAVYAVKQ